MFGFKRRNREKRCEQTAEQLEILQRWLFDQLRPSLAKEFGDEYGDRLAQAVVDRFLVRPSSLARDDLIFGEQLAARIASEHQEIRDVVFVSLRAMLEVEGAKNHFAAERKILDTIQWMKQFGEIPQGNSQLHALQELIQTLPVGSWPGNTSLTRESCPKN